jgi:hypothetical protein
MNLGFMYPSLLVLLNWVALVSCSYDCRFKDDYVQDYRMTVD